MPQYADGLAHDKEADAQTVALGRFQASKRLKDSWHLISRDANSSIVHVDTDALAGATATKKNATAGLCVFDGIANQVAQDGAEEQRVAANRSAGLNNANADPSLQSSNLVFATYLSKQGLDWHRH